MLIDKYTYVDDNKHTITAYWFNDRYRYTVNTESGIEYREVITPAVNSANALETLLDHDISKFPYKEPQRSGKCIRCSKHHGAPRKEYNLASICDRCYRVMVSDTKANTASVFYMINEDGSKGSAMK